MSQGRTIRAYTFKGVVCCGGDCDGAGGFEHVPWLTLVRAHRQSRTRLIDAVAEQQNSLQSSQGTAGILSPQRPSCGLHRLQKEKSET